LRLKNIFSQFFCDNVQNVFEYLSEGLSLNIVEARSKVIHVGSYVQYHEIILFSLILTRASWTHRARALALGHHGRHVRGPRL